ncbi:3-isopropylmalate dehydratase large subunit [Bradyrhizobium sp. BR 10289]|uniref:3-isopropylmalate dehydratase large subunit n=1 Tax=Bradyrhizobium sp. BR 10289 TaxID=2749993 RepID=UPI001C65248D|nr:3-isopropylmalate dehydratase large subunit [Bradyrhizobium sp. BR 10289]MBW7970240.1 3-isopropylmalate dehydratase large subunit [Bradyrhizobium sp. BR 10289]
MSETLVQKIISRHLGGKAVKPGDVVMLPCDVVLGNDASTNGAIRVLHEMGVDRLPDPSKVVTVADHFAPAKDVISATLLKQMQDWAQEQGVAFYGQGRGGIEHTVLIEEGWVVPGSVIAGGDSHTCTYGALGAFGTGVGLTDLACCMATGMFWQTVPDTIRVVFSGTRRPFVRGKDLILAVLAQTGVAGATGSVLEFTGSAVVDLSIDDRMAVSNMAVEAGAETGFFPADGVTAEYLQSRANRAWSAEASDSDATFARELHIDLNTLSPQLAWPHLPGNVTAASEADTKKVDQVYIGNCANGTITDLRDAAAMMRGRQVANGTRMIVVPASRRVYKQALEEGLLQVFVEAGAVVSAPTCGACFGGHNGVMAAGERVVATTNRNFRGRMGSPEAEVFLANASVAAAAAVAGRIIDPRELESAA